MSDVPTAIRTVGIIADPGIAQTLASRASQKLEDRLNQAVDASYKWKIHVDSYTLPMGKSGRVALNDKVPTLREKHGWNYIIYLTDVPHYVQDRPVRSVVSYQESSAVISVPSLGFARLSVLIKHLAKLIQELSTGQPPVAPPSQLRKKISIEASLPDGEQSQDRVTSIEGLRGRLLLIGGMIRSNRPWRLVPKLSSAMAGAVATGAFGVFYTSIWSMADYLSTPRLASITVFSILVLTLWLLLHNRLWEKPEGSRRRERLIIYNTATVLTVALAASAMYILLFIALMAGSLIVIDQDYLASQLAHEVGLAEYFNLAWLASSLGLLGSAVGSSFDDVARVQRATFSQREYERRNMEFSIDNSEADSA
ncbi:hypothetical protein [Glutamicibacter sp. JC586]|uniref:hypothetical protein n=1 Tax=Glutamicibacter sp. JC586 TaxID=2590552 RepID=UPI001357ED68|nr:hypothetical protein [Glutamicibacter sp. JC586]